MKIFSCIFGGIIGLSASVAVAWCIYVAVLILSAYLNGETQTWVGF